MLSKSVSSPKWKGKTEWKAISAKDHVSVFNEMNQSSSWYPRGNIRFGDHLIITENKQEVRKGCTR